MLLESSKFRSEEMPKRSRDKQRLAHLHREIQVCFSFFLPFSYGVFINISHHTEVQYYIYFIFYDYTENESRN